MTLKLIFTNMIIPNTPNKKLSSCYKKQIKKRWFNIRNCLKGCKLFKEVIYPKTPNKTTNINYKAFIIYRSSRLRIEPKKLLF